MRDPEVVASIVAGDPRGLATAYDWYADPLFKYCRTLLSDPADAADAVQDTFVIAASRLDGLRDPERFRSWLYTVARNECLRILRAKKGTSALDEAPEVTDDSADVSQHAERAELKTLFEQASAGLNPGEREVIELQLRQGLEAGEVASVLGVSRNHAHSLLSRARDQLETCLGVLLVAKAGRGECSELDSALSGWDGRLTVLLRKRVHRHIEHCAICTAKRAFELRPAMLLDLSPGAALAAGAAASFKLAAGAPAVLKGHTLAVAAGHGPVAVAHSAAVLARTGAFGKGGFPKPAPGGHAGAAGQHGAGPLKRLRNNPQGQAAVAAGVVVAVAVAATAFALTGKDEHFTPAAAPKPPSSAPAPPTVPAAKAPPGQPAGQPSSSGPTAPAAAPVSAQPAQPTPAATNPAAVPVTGTPGTTTQASPQTPPPAADPATASPPAPPATTPATAPVAATSPSPPPAATTPVPTTPVPTTPAPTTPAPTTPASTPATAAPPPSSPAATPAPTGTLHVIPAGGTLLVLPGPLGAAVDLSATGGAVTWSASVGNDPNHLVTVTPAAGTAATANILTSPLQTTVVTIKISQYVTCGGISTTPCPTVTFAPGGATFSVWTGSILPLSLLSAGTSAAPAALTTTTAVVVPGPATGSSSRSAAPGRRTDTA